VRYWRGCVGLESEEEKGWEKKDVKSFLVGGGVSLTEEIAIPRRVDSSSRFPFSVPFLLLLSLRSPSYSLPATNHHTSQK
jgi:hypothetical protein